jgi:cytochrome c oxidase subunit II
VTVSSVPTTRLIPGPRFSRFLRCAFGILLCVSFGLASEGVAQEASTSPPTDFSPGDATSQPNIFSPVSTPAEVVEDLSWLVLAVTACIFFVVFAVLTITIIRFRVRSGDDDREPPQIYGSNPIELAWTVVPILIVAVLTLVTVRSLYALDKKEPPEGSLEVIVVGHQWWWEFRYPELGIITANELHVPVDRVTFLRLASADVVHSFWVPELAGKTDVVPNRLNHMWIEPHKTGLFVGQCAEFCGTQHANMLLRVEVQAEEDFAAWVANQQKPAREDPSVAEGRETFQQIACINCHNSEGTVATGVFGPDLTHLMSRETIGSGSVLLTPENLHEWVKNPQQFKDGCLMPDMQLEPHQVDSITRYLLSLD